MRSAAMVPPAPYDGWLSAGRAVLRSTVASSLRLRASDPHTGLQGGTDLEFGALLHDPESPGFHCPAGGLDLRRHQELLVLDGDLADLVALDRVAAHQPPELGAAGRAGLLLAEE